MKRIGILTSGGDCAGLNAVIRAVTLRANHGHHCAVVGIRYGTLGLLERPVAAMVLDPDRLDPTLMREGGTFLGTTNKGNPFAFPMEDGTVRNRAGEMVDGLKQLALDGLIGVGGDGSLAILRRLFANSGVPLIGIPKTIDNDVTRTERAIGYGTAVAVATEALDRLQPTGASHDRIMVLEVMGRDAGHIAIAAGIAGGADVVLIPEINWTPERVARHIEAIRSKGRRTALVVVAEAAARGEELALQLANLTGAEARATVLGHVQRGAEPTVDDRLLASAFGVRAVDLLAEGGADRMVAWWNRRVIDVPLAEVAGRSRTVDEEGALVKTARALGICLGDGEI